MYIYSYIYIYIYIDVDRQTDRQTDLDIPAHPIQRLDVARDTPGTEAGVG